MKEKMVSIRLDPLDNRFSTLAQDISPDSINLQNKFQLKAINNSGVKDSIYVKYNIEIDGYSKVIKFCDTTLEEPVTEKERKNFDKEKANERAKLEKEYQK